MYYVIRSIPRTEAAEGKTNQEVHGTSKERNSTGQTSFDVVVQLKSTRKSFSQEHVMRQDRIDSILLQHSKESKQTQR